MMPDNLTCCLCGKESRMTMPAAGANGWDWFKGFMEKRLEFCPACKLKTQRDELFELSRRRPVTVGAAHE